MQADLTTNPPPAVRPSLWERVKVVRWVWMPLMLVLVTRIGVAFIILMAMPILPQNPNIPEGWHATQNNLVVDGLGARWDTGFYLSIASEGYQNEGVRFPSVAFFPLLPLFIKAVRPLFGGDTMIAGLVVTNMALAGAAILFYRLVQEEWGDAVADRAVWYWLIFPVSFFGSAIYTESLFLLCAIGSLYFMRRGYWESSAMLAIGATLTRFVGLIVAPLLLIEWWMLRRNRPDGQKPSWKGLIAPFIAPLGTLLYMAYLQIVFGDPLAFIKASAAWAREPQPIWETVSELFTAHTGGWLESLFAGSLQIDNWFDFLTVALFISLGLVLLYQRRFSETAFVLLGALIPLNSGLLMSQRRYMWVLFPAFVVLAHWGSRSWVDRLITTLSLVFLGLFTALFSEWYWVG